MFICTRCGWLTPKAEEVVDEKWGVIYVCGVCGEDMIHAAKCYCGGWMQPDKEICDFCENRIERRMDALIGTLMVETSIPRRVIRKIAREMI